MYFKTSPNNHRPYRNIRGCPKWTIMRRKLLWSSKQFVLTEMRLTTPPPSLLDHWSSMTGRPSTAANKADNHTFNHVTARRWLVLLSKTLLLVTRNNYNHHNKMIGNLPSTSGNIIMLPAKKNEQRHRQPQVLVGHLLALPVLLKQPAWWIKVLAFSSSSDGKRDRTAFLEPNQSEKNMMVNTLRGRRFWWQRKTCILPGLVLFSKGIQPMHNGDDACNVVAFFAGTTSREQVTFFWF